MRLFKAISYFFRMVFDTNFYNTVRSADEGKFIRPFQILSILQREGRFIDFLMEDVSSFTDAQVGAVARTVQKGCKKGLFEYISIEPLAKEKEGDNITIEKGFDPASFRLSGNVKGEPPFKGSLTHHGWQMPKVNFPVTASQSDSIISPAEIEIS